MRKSMKRSDFESMADIEDLLRNHYSSINPDTEGIDLNAMAEKVMSSKRTDIHRSLFRLPGKWKTQRPRIKLIISSCGLLFGLVLSPFYLSPVLAKEMIASMPGFMISILTLKTINPQKWKAIESPMMSPLLSAMGNPSPATSITPIPKGLLKMRGLTGPFHATVKSGHAYLLTAAPTLKGGIAVGGDFYSGGYIICRAVGSGKTYTGAIKVGKVQEKSDYIATPPGTYDVYIASTRPGDQIFSSMNVYFN